MGKRFLLCIVEGDTEEEEDDNGAGSSFISAS